LELNKKGFTYIIIVIVIMMFTTMLFLLSKSINYKENKSDAIINNYKNELMFLIEENPDEITLDSFNSSFKEYIKSNNYNSKICVIFYNGDEYYISNYQDFNYSIIDDKTTLKLLKEDVLEDISFGECDLNISINQNLTYYLEIYNNKEKKVSNQ
jgi:hypothetical protein